MKCDLRVGLGYDVHALADGLPLVLGGVRVAHSKGCVAHSDGDVLAHALADAVLGAAALGDIGLHFPDTDERWRGADSLSLLRLCVALAAEKGWAVGNADCVIAMQLPKLRPFIDPMRQRIAAALGVDIDCVSVKATTTERLGFEGRQEGVSAQAAVLLHRVL